MSKIDLWSRNKTTIISKPGGSMCVACTEYAKEKLTLDEFKSALKEIAIDSPAHKERVEKLIQNHGSQPDVLRRAVAPKPEDPKDY